MKPPVAAILIYTSLSGCNAMTFAHKFTNACADGATNIDGNWYCSDSVQAVTYVGFQQAGAYSRVVSMENGQCSQQPQNFESPLGSFGTGNDISWHFRGQLQLNQFAYYTLENRQTKRDMKPSFHERRHSHAQYHHKRLVNREIEKRRIAEVEKRAVCDLVSATFGTVVATWTNYWDGKTNLPSSVCAPKATSASSSTRPADPLITTTITKTIYSGTVTVTKYTTTTTVTFSVVYASSTSSAALPGTGLPASSQLHSSALPIRPPPSMSSPSANNEGYTRKGYFNATDQFSTGLAFLNHMGGQGSGTWDNQFGNSLSYASSDVKSGSATPQVFDGNLDGDTELVIFSDQDCSSSDVCGYSRPDTVAHVGFENTESLFLFDFSMPISGQNPDASELPAIWLLNAQIPRTLQYGPPECSCWSSGCGEMDIFEVLDAGDTRMKATWHGDNPGGSSYYFQRPQTLQKAGVLLSESNAAVTIFYLPDDAEFSADLTADTVNSWIENAASQGALFTLSS